MQRKFGPLVAAGMLIGVGIGGLLEAVIFRQILGAHAFLSAKSPIKAVPDLKSSLVWDGVVQFVLLICLVAGLLTLFRAGKRAEVHWSGQLLFGSWFLGWGFYMLVEGLLSHHVLRLHHLLEYANPASQETGDYAYLIVGALLAILGYWAVSSTRSELENEAREALRSKQRAKEVKGDRKVYLD